MGDIAILLAAAVAAVILIIGASVLTIVRLLRVVVDDAPRGALKYVCRLWPGARPAE